MIARARSLVARVRAWWRRGPDEAAASLELERTAAMFGFTRAPGESDEGLRDRLTVWMARPGIDDDWMEAAHGS